MQRCDGTPCHRPMAHPPPEQEVTVAEDDTTGEGHIQKRTLETLGDRERGSRGGGL